MGTAVRLRRRETREERGEKCKGDCESTNGTQVGKGDRDTVTGES